MVRQWRWGGVALRVDVAGKMAGNVEVEIGGA